MVRNHSMLAILAASTSSLLTCDAVKSLYQDSNCCPHAGGTPSTPVSPECANNEMERKCLTLASRMTQNYANIFRTNLKTDPADASPYCFVEGVTTGDQQAPFAVAMPLNVSMYESRLFFRTNYEDDGNPSVYFDNVDLFIMRTYKGIRGAVVTNGDATNVATSTISGLFGVEHAVVDRSISRAMSRHGVVLWLLKRAVNDMATQMYGSPPSKSYIGGCSGMGMSAMVNAGLDSTWDGVVAGDFNEVTEWYSSLWQRFRPYIMKQLTANDYESNNYFARKYCDALDGVNDDKATWDCGGKYNPRMYACEGVVGNESATLPGFATVPGWFPNYCFSEEKLVAFDTMYAHPLSMGVFEDGVGDPVDAEWDTLSAEAYGIPANYEKFMQRETAADLSGFAGGLNVIFLPDSRFQDTARKQFAILEPELAWELDKAAMRSVKARKRYLQTKTDDDFDAQYEWIRLLMGTNRSITERAFKYVREIQSVISSRPRMDHWKTMMERGSKVIMATRTGDGLSVSSQGRVLWEKLWSQPWANNNRLIMDRWMRLYPLGSSSHCGSSLGEQDVPSGFEFQVLIDWVEKGVPPDTYTYKQWPGQEVVRGLLCQFPLTERLVNGSYTCECLDERLCAYPPFPPPSPPPPSTPPPSPKVTVTFRLNAATYSGAVENPVFTLAGTFNSWTPAPMSDEDGDGVWELQLEFAQGAYEYKFVVGAWTDQEELTPGGSCTKTGQYTNRLLTIQADTPSNYVLDIVCLSSCNNCT